MTSRYDVIVVGSGFAGSLIAMIAKRLGYSVLLVEKGTHPRINIGESSTPLANLLLEELCRRYDLAALRPLSKWGSWQHAYPKIACGLKRGFTFYHHALESPDNPCRNPANELLVAASPHDEIADTHWYRADFDHLLVQQAQLFGVEYLDHVSIQQFNVQPNSVELELLANNRQYQCSARILLDATGPRGFIHQALSIPQKSFHDYPQTQALYSHFTGVTRPEPAPTAFGGTAPPYPAEDAAVHHVFEGGWIWVLRFNNGVTSAGVAASQQLAEQLRLQEGAVAWSRLINLIPALREQFVHAEPIQPFRHIPRLSYFAGQVQGGTWAMLPSAVGFVDPLLSTGFPLTLLGIARLARILERGLDSASLATDLHSYGDITVRELHATSRLIAALYANMNRFEVFKTICLLYFAAASYSETAHRLDKSHLATSFLLCDHPAFGPATDALLRRAIAIASDSEASQLILDIHCAIEPFDVAGLTRSDRSAWYPVDAEDLLEAAAKVESTPEEIQALLQRCGFYAAHS
ncbi:NAD(P)/FAD-dependent oxidoreductase [Acidicapsa dinghuensis]|uniref:NAD(P)/FAD-dependent oxidoreductase n=1 Tax=Acidicapsa dinghuensis TaxID=2218256 RepID=A0ABW1EDH3_9BACT|nr:tryptophan 7-halogenase [Acidicapsa dinghuensis]